VQRANGRTAKPETIDEYLAPLNNEKRATLEKLRRAIQSAAPNAQECISYQLPAFRLGGRMLVAFGAAANHCAFYPGATPVKVHKAELAAYDTSKGTIRFPVDRPLPATLVRKLVKTRIAEYAGEHDMLAKGLTPILNVSDIQQSFDWFEKLGWKKSWDWGSRTSGTRTDTSSGSAAGRKKGSSSSRSGA